MATKLQTSQSSEAGEKLYFSKKYLNFSLNLMSFGSSEAIMGEPDKLLGEEFKLTKEQIESVYNFIKNNSDNGSDQIAIKMRKFFQRN